MLYGEQ